jgi:hypothetical protein
MVRVDTIDEIQEKREMEKAPPAEKFSALDYTKAIASTLALDGGSIGSLIKDGRIGWLKYTENMSAGDLAKTIATLVIFSAVGNLKPTKSGAISFAKSKGNPITPSFKEKVEKAVEKYNEQPRGKQLEGLQKIRQSSVDALTSLLRDTTNKADIQTIKGELAEAAKKLNETKENIKAEAKRNADEAAQVERIKERVRQENQKTKFEKENDAKVADYFKRKEAYDAKVKEILKNNPNAFKTKVSAKTAKERREIEMMDIFRDPAEVAKEQAEIARLKKEGLELEQEKGLLDSQAKQAEAKESGGVDSKASESKTEKPNSERLDSKESAPSKTAPAKAPSKKAPSKEPSNRPSTKEEADKIVDKEAKERRDRENKEAMEKSEREDKPDFSDPVDETEPLLEKSEGKEKTLDETIDSAIELNRQEREASSKVKKAATAGTIGTITAEVVDKLTNTKDRNPRRTFEEADDNAGFTNKPVVEGEEGTQSINEPTAAPSPAQAQASISFTNHKEKRTQNTENIDELFSITIKVCTDVYDNKIGEERNYYYYGDFDIPVLLFVSQKILYIGFRGTKLNFSSLEDSRDSIRNILTDLTTSDFKPFKNNNNSNFLNRHEPFNKILDSNASNIEFSLGVILSLKLSYSFIINKIKDIDHSINSIVVTGHSLGGAMAQLFTYVYNNSIQDKYNKIPIKYLVTYGQPRILFDKPEYIKLFNNSVDNYHRVWNTLDPIPYLPFKKKVVIDNMLGSEIMSGYTHVGDSFNISGNIVNNDVNLLLYEILKGNKQKIEMLLDNKDLLTNSKLLKFMLSDKYLSLQLYTFYKCLENVEVKEEITQEQLTFLTKELQKDTSKLLSYAEKCDLVKPWGISEILKMNPIGDDVDEQNFTIDCIAGCSIASNKLTSKAHKLEYYHEQLDKLIARQIDDKKPIFEVIDKIDFYERRTNLFDGVIGMIEGDFENGSIIEF